MYYPGVDGVWPKNRWRLMWSKIWERERSRPRARTQAADGNAPAERPRDEDDWQGTRLPGISAKGTGGTSPFRSHRWAVPIDRDFTRIIYLNIERYFEPPSLKTRLLRNMSWPVRNFDHNFNFRYADVDAERTCRYDLPEYLSPTDSTVVVIRKVLAEYARGVHNREDLEELSATETREEEIVLQRNLEALSASHSVQAEGIRE